MKKTELKTIAQTYGCDVVEGDYIRAVNNKTTSLQIEVIKNRVRVVNKQHNQLLFSCPPNKFNEFFEKYWFLKVTK